MYSDGALPFGEIDKGDPHDPIYRGGLSAVAHLYNTCKDSVYLQKDKRPQIHRVGVLDIEKSQLPDIQPNTWHTDTCIGDWFYDVRRPYKKPKQIIEMLIDIVSKNGNMLLNIIQRPDGSLDDEVLLLLEELADWFAICNEAIYGTRPWRVYSEGEARVRIDGFKEEAVQWGSSDYRFTKKGDTLYAFLLAPPQNQVAVIKSLNENEPIKKARLLGYGDVPFIQAYGVVNIKLPAALPSKYANCIALELA
jgi:alpha-L-fucosidase